MDIQTQDSTIQHATPVNAHGGDLDPAIPPVLAAADSSAKAANRKVIIDEDDKATVEQEVAEIKALEESAASKAKKEQEEEEEKKIIEEAKMKAVGMPTNQQAWDYYQAYRKAHPLDNPWSKEEKIENIKTFASGGAKVALVAVVGALSPLAGIVGVSLLALTLGNYFLEKHREKKMEMASEAKNRYTAIRREETALKNAAQHTPLESYDPSLFKNLETSLDHDPAWKEGNHSV